MARPQKQTVDYFPHSCNHKKTMFIIEERYGNNGYAFWFKLLEMIGNAKGHYIDLGDPSEMEFLLAKTHVSEVIGLEMLNLLAKLEAIDSEAWSRKAIWCQNFIDGVASVYQNRQQSLPQKPSFNDQKLGCAVVSSNRNTSDGVVPMVENTQTIVEETIVEETIVDKDKHTTPFEPLEDMSPIEQELSELKGWGRFTMDDRAWAEKFLVDYHGVLPVDIRECADWWYGKAEQDKKIKHSAGQWKTRLRNWLKRRAEFSAGRTNGTTRRSIPGNKATGAFADAQS